MQIISLTERDERRRLDKFLMAYLDLAPKSFLYKMLRKKNITLNGKKAEPGALLAAGDEITLWLSDETIAGFRSVQRKQSDCQGTAETVFSEAGNTPKRLYDIVYEDSEIVIADKSAGLLTQKAKPSDISLNELLWQHLSAEGGSAAEEETFHPSVCNRLDRNTSGLVTFAKTYRAARVLSYLFKERLVHKYYYALVKGSLEGALHAEGYLKKDARTNRVIVSEEPFAAAVRFEARYEAEERLGTEYTLLRILLITGKTHQIRAHLSELGHPVLGDPKYGSPKLNRTLQKKASLTRQLLHAGELCMPAAVPEPLSSLSGRIFRAQLPDDFRQVLDTLRKEIS